MKGKITEAWAVRVLRLHAVLDAGKKEMGETEERLFHACLPIIVLDVPPPERKEAAAKCFGELRSLLFKRKEQVEELSATYAEARPESKDALPPAHEIPPLAQSVLLGIPAALAQLENELESVSARLAMMDAELLATLGTAKRQGLIDAKGEGESHGN